MDDLVNEAMYGKPLASRIYGQGYEKVSNRWMLGWPEQTQALIESGHYLELLAEQVERELDVLTGVDSAQRHLADHELLELAGISPRPPVLSANVRSTDLACGFALDDRSYV